MCLAYPMKVVAIEKDYAFCETSGIRRKVGIQLISNLRVGDYVMVHAGFAIERLNKDAAEETLKVLEEYEDALRGSTAQQKTRKSFSKKDS